MTDAEVQDRADTLAEGLVAEDRPEALWEYAMAEFVGEPIVLHDVRSSVEHFDRQELALARLGLGFPCVEIPDNVPFPLALNTEGLDRDVEAARAHMQLALNGLGVEDNLVRPHDPKEARGFLARRLAAFLAPRIAASKSVPTTPPSRGYKFRVETPGRSGLRIHYSPAYFFDPTNVFGSALSTPVEGVLLAGRYVFGTMTPTALPKWDLSAVYRLPGPLDVALIY